MYVRVRVTRIYSIENIRRKIGEEMKKGGKKQNENTIYRMGEKYLLIIYLIRG